MLKVRRALISIADKNNLDILADLLKNHSIETIATGKTAQSLAEHGVQSIPVSSITGYPDLLEGRVKTLHPAIYAGILARRDHRQDQQDLHQQDLEPIDLVVVNLYPFAEKVSQRAGTDEIIANIDIGGLAMIRAAAKNHLHTALITSPQDYADLAQELAENDGKLSPSFRSARAGAAFLLTADYDRQIADYLARLYKDERPANFLFGGYHPKDLRYGENPHQTARLYADSSPPRGLSAARCLQGRPMSYNNYLDADLALTIVTGFEDPACVIVKHAQPCGVAEHQTLAAAYRAAYQADQESAFGGVIACNRALDQETAALIRRQFAELVVAPAMTDEAIATLKDKKNLRLLVSSPVASSRQIRGIHGGWLVQSSHRLNSAASDWVASKPQNSSVLDDLIFAWRVVQFCRSNAIVIAKGGATCGIGAGQTSRVFSVRCALLRAADNNCDLQGAVLASDAFFPFADSIALIAKAGIAAIIQPGGSKRDAEVIEAARRHNIAMAFTGQRCFWHG